MTDPSDEPARNPVQMRAASEFAPAYRQGMLTEYLWSNRNRFTDAALASAARAAGYTPEEIATAATYVERRRAGEAAAKPVKARARRYILAGYGITFLLFAIAFLRPASTQSPYVSGGLLLGILAFAMLVALMLGFVWVAARRPSAERAEGALGVMLAVPFVLLILVAGLCVVSTSSIIFAPGA